MKAYAYAFVLYWLNALNYRFQTVIQLLFGNLSLVVTLLFWRLIYQNNPGQALNGYTLSAILTYFLAGKLTQAFVLDGSGYTLAAQIKSGALSGQLLKPVQPGAMLLVRTLASKLTAQLPQFLLTLAVLPFCYSWLTLRFSAVNLLFLLLFLLISALSSHLLWSILGSMAFWMEEANAVMWSFAVLFNLLTGVFLPLDFFPAWSLPLLEALPFAAWGYLPAKICLGLFSSSALLRLLMINLLWLLVLWRLKARIWQLGLRRYTAVGG